MIKKRFLIAQCGFGIGTLCERDRDITFGNRKIRCRYVHIALRFFCSLRRGRIAQRQSLLARIGCLALCKNGASTHDIRPGFPNCSLCGFD